ncbi:MAG: hypothetical protein A2Y57_01345 [Candidatus Woykebacteria bacterium RBG_13_40_7b]|uniref:Cohesin domain-containing protein n=1 Tax=Candidatus Woykebacteria bacterium RBG_13_40_7b TaxID=1802594 RepID=A0A1G1WA36_9BACT|nr:MAG: hypothetical protein A2Y57_01345 [Candidatus Woykebacteria bacterium RBG_13_40_7b]
MKRTAQILLSLSLALGGLLFNTNQAFAAASLSFSPASGSFAKDSTLTVSVIANTGGENVNSIQAYFSYPADKLQFLSIGTEGSPLSMFWEKLEAGGVVKIAGSLPTPGFSGSKSIATVTFKVKVDSGSGALSFTNDSVVLRDSDSANILSGKSGGSFTFKKAAVAPTAPPPDETPPKISGVRVTKIATASAIIVWKTDEPSTSVVEYGLNTNYGAAATSTDLATEHNIKLTSTILVPATTFHFRVLSKDAAGNQAVGDDKNFTTKGLVVKIKVIDQRNKLFEGVKVKLYSSPQETTTDKEGIALFTTVTPGVHSLVLEYQGKSYSHEIDVKEIATTQSFEFTLQRGFVIFANWQLILGGVLGLIALALLGFLVWKRKLFRRAPTVFLNKK